MRSFLKLIRWPNLLIVMVSMIFTMFLVIKPVLGIGSTMPGMSWLQFSLLILATLLITAGGYLINDFFDMEADGINKPGQNQVGKRYAVARIQLLYWLFTVLGVLLGSTMSWQLNKIEYALVFVFAAGLLWFYSERYKCIPVVGNVVVAFLSALSFGLVWVFEFFALSSHPAVFTMVQSEFPLLNTFILMYMGFAFIVSLLREIIKDMEDREGDDRYGCRTTAVAYGTRKSRILGIIIASVGVVFSLWFQYFAYTASLYFLPGYFVIVDIMFLLIILRLTKSREKADYTSLSFFTKILMLTGILSMVLVYFEF